MEIQILTLLKGFVTMRDAKNYKDAKDLIERLSQEIHGDTLNIKFNKFFTSPLFRRKKSWKDLVSA